MKTLTVCPGWAELFFLPENPKDVENRSWPTSHRGPLLIHAGKSKKAIVLARAYCRTEHLRFLDPSVFGAVSVLDRESDALGSLWVRFGIMCGAIDYPIAHGVPVYSSFEEAAAMSGEVLDAT